MTQTWLDILATAGVSALVALAIAACFYIYASMDLRDTERNLKKATDEVLIEVENLRFLNNLILIALQNAGLADLRRDKRGKIIGLNITVHVSVESVTLQAQPATVDGKGEVKPKGPDA